MISENTDNKYRLMIVEDEINILEGLKYSVEWAAMGFEVVGEAENAEDALAVVDDVNPDVMLVDINLPGENGLSLIEKLKFINEDLLYVILSGYDDFYYAQKAIDLKVSKYLLKPTTDEKIEDVFAGVYDTLESKSVATHEFISEALFDERKINEYDKEKIKLLKQLINHEEEINLNEYNLIFDCDKFFSTSVICDYKKDYLFTENIINKCEKAKSNFEISYFPFTVEENTCVIVFESEENTSQIKKEFTDIFDNIQKEPLYVYSGFFYGIKGLIKSCKRAGSLFKISKGAYSEDDFLTSKVIRFINENYMHQLKLTDIAHNHNISSSYLCTYFKKRIGMNLFDYIKKMRLDKAKKMLKSTEKNITEVSDLIGYLDYRQFSKYFKDYTGYTPSEYRKSKLSKLI